MLIMLLLFFYSFVITVTCYIKHIKLIYKIHIFLIIYLMIINYQQKQLFLELGSRKSAQSPEPISLDNWKQLSEQEAVIPAQYAGIGALELLVFVRSLLLQLSFKVSPFLPSFLPFPTLAACWRLASACDVVVQQTKV